MNHASPMTQLIMPGGWHFQDIIPEANSYEDLIERLRVYYESNRILGRDPKREVDAYICQHWPHYCQDPNVRAVEAQQQSSGKETRARLLDRVAKWVHNAWTKGELEYVGHNTMQQRMQVCQDCPYNKHWATCSQCGDLINQVRDFASKILQTRDNNAALKACDTCNHLNNVAVWLKNKHLTRGNQAPQHCWVGKEL